MTSSNHGCCSSTVTLNRHSVVVTPSLQMEYAPPLLQTVLSCCQAKPSFPIDFDDLFLFPDVDFGDSVAQAEPLLEMEEIEEELWLEEDGGGGISSGDLSSSSESDFSSFLTPLIRPTASFHSRFQPDSSSHSTLPATSTDTHAALQKQPLKHSHNRRQRHQDQAVMFIVEGDGNSLYDGYSWRKYGEKSIKRRDYCRSYYRCGHDGCMVKKQVERSSENPAEYLITYYGRHNHYAVTNFSSIGYN